MSKFTNILQAATIERQVEDAYNQALKTTFGNDIDFKYPFACDGFFSFEVNGKKHTCLIEYKLDKELGSKVSRAKVLAQVVFYLKRFENAGQPFPEVCMVADKNECFIMHMNALLKHLDVEGIPWDKAPSSAGNYGDLVLAISEDPGINPFVYDVQVGFNFWDVVEKIKSVASGTVRQIRITEHNVDRVFKMFSDKVIQEKVQPNDLVALFFGVITGDEDIYLHPVKKNILVNKGDNVRVNADWFKAFVGHFATKCTSKDKARLTAISDRLIEDITRRKKGEFYTPTPFVDYAHGMIEKWLGEDWKDQYVVWDCAAGTKNLTRDYKFRELYCSTLEESELEISKQYNPEAVSFVFDFLNDPLEKLPQGLLDAFKGGKKILFFINPPYGKATGDNNLQGGKVESGASNTLVKKLMQGENLEGSELLKQFLWRIIDIKRRYGIDCKLACFTNPTWLCKAQSKEFRKFFFDNFSFSGGFMLCASEFTSVSSSWGITFNLWDGYPSQERTSFPHTLLQTDDMGEIKNIGQHIIYNSDDDDFSINSFVSKPLKAISKVKQQLPVINCGTSISDVCEKNYPAPYLGNVALPGNSIQHSAFTAFYSGGSTVGGRIPVCKENFDEACAAVAVRKLVESTWINQKDEYLSPNMTSSNWQSFVNDSIVYSIFQGQQTSLRAIDYKGKLWDIPNEFFFMSKSEIEDLADQLSLDQTYQDAHTSKDRFVYLKLQGLTLSPEAQAVLDKARDLVRKSFKYRSLFDDEHPEYQILNWDCGWYQVKAILKQYLPQDLEEFKALYKALGNKLRPLVYELGFLKK